MRVAVGDRTALGGLSGEPEVAGFLQEKQQVQKAETDEALGCYGRQEGPCDWQRQPGARVGRGGHGGAPSGRALPGIGRWHFALSDGKSLEGARGMTQSGPFRGCLVERGLQGAGVGREAARVRGEPGLGCAPVPRAMRLPSPGSGTLAASGTGVRGQGVPPRCFQTFPAAGQSGQKWPPEPQTCPNPPLELSLRTPE